MIGATATRLSAEIARQGALSRELARAQVDISSTTRLQAGSDDPAAAARLAGLRRAQASEAVWATNAEAGAATATRVASRLDGVAIDLDRARELMLRARNGTESAESRAAIAAELTGIADDIAAAQSAKDANGRDLFPVGDPIALPIGEGVTIAAAVSRDDAFAGVETMLRTALQGVLDGDDAAMQAGLDGVAAAGDTLARVRGEHGVRAARLDAARAALAGSAVELEAERGALEGTDLAATLARATQVKLTLDAAQAMFAKLNSKTLFDLL